MRAVYPRVSMDTYIDREIQEEPEAYMFLAPPEFPYQLPSSCNGVLHILNLHGCAKNISGASWICLAMPETFLAHPEIPLFIPEFTYTLPEFP